MYKCVYVFIFFKYIQSCLNIKFYFDKLKVIGTILTCEYAITKKKKKSICYSVTEGYHASPAMVTLNFYPDWIR